MSVKMIAATPASSNRCAISSAVTSDVAALNVGKSDLAKTTAIGKDLASPEVRAALGNYPVLGKKAAAQIQHCKLVEFPDLGHAPQIQAPERFHNVLLEGLKSSTSAP